MTGDTADTPLVTSAATTAPHGPGQTPDRW